MSLDTVTEDITDDAQEQADHIREEAQERAGEIIEKAEEEAAELLESREREVERRIEQEREQKLSSAKLEAKQLRLEARREILQDVRNSVEEQIRELSGEQREQLTRELLGAATAEFDTESIESDELAVYGREDDKELLESIFEDEDEEYTYAGPYDCLGGCVVESETSRVRVNNTFDSILESVWDDQLREISNQLFEKDDN